jgi:beta-glucosidase
VDFSAHIEHDGAMLRTSAALVSGALLLACSAGPVPTAKSDARAASNWGAPWVARSGDWPTEGCTERAESLLAAMTLEEKAGQMTQGERAALAPGDIQRLALGSVLSGGGSAPGKASPAEWADMLDAMHREARSTRLGIPLLYGSDAVHGHGNVVGATIFPHNIGLGCAGDPGLVEAVAHATALELYGTGVDWTFAPAVGAGRDERWGRTYETFSEDPAAAGLLGAAAVRGYQGARLGGDPTSVLACAKHFAGDGSTAFGSAASALLDQGDTRLSAEDFERIAVAPYLPSIRAGVGSIMVSFNSVHGRKMHGHAELLTNTLKGRLGFRGFLVSDWLGIQQLPGSYADQVTTSVNAGIDLFMEAESFERFRNTLLEVVKAGRVPMARVDDAVRRILTVKCEAGLFEKGPVDRNATANVGGKAHRELARRAARASAVLLKNDGNLLPLAPGKKILVAGTGAASLTRQAGGWTVGWMGADERPFLGTTLLDALRESAKNPADVSYDATGKTGEGDVALLVMSEPAYAEGRGDSATIAPPESDLTALDTLRTRGFDVAVVLYSGRPLVIEPHLDKARAWLAAWLPGSAGEGIADVLLGAYAPTGKLSHSWPRRVEDLPLNHGDLRYDPLFPLGYGLSYARAPAP